MGKFRDLMEDIKTACTELMQFPNEEEYPILGIYDEGEIVLTQEPWQVFLQDAVSEFAFIRDITGEGHSLGMGLTAYNPSYVDYDLGSIMDIDTWQTIVDNHFGDCVKDDKNKNLLRFALMSKHPLDTHIFDLLRKAYPETDIKDILWKCHRLTAAKWALEHGADKDYDGLTEPMQYAMSHWYRTKVEGRAIFEYLYGCDPDEYRRTWKR